MVDTADTADMAAMAGRGGVSLAATEENLTATEEILMLNTKVVTWSLALFGAVTFLVCVLYGLIAPAALHMTSWLEQVLPGFRWLTLGGFAIGLVESFLYGVFAGLVFTPIYNAMATRWPDVPRR